MKAKYIDLTNGLTNNELTSIYDYLQGTITQAQLCKEVKRARTNTYYYVGRAAAIWIKEGVLKFENVKKPEDLGGADL